MPVNKLFGATIETMHHSLNLRQERHGLIQSNIANHETPGYVGQDFKFARVMESVVAGQGQLARTDPKHLQRDPAAMSKAGDFAQEKKPVDLDEEMVNLAENQLMYQVVTRMIGKKFEGMRYAIDEGGK